MTACIASYESDADYHADRERLSGSNLDLFEENPGLFAAWRRGRWEKKQTPAMAFGQLFHALVLEPDTVKDRFAEEPEDPERPGKCIRRNTNAYKQWKRDTEAAGKTVIAADDMAKLRPMVNALTRNPDVADLLTCEGGQNEVALHFNVEDAGRPMRAKLDRIIPDRDIIVELKTARGVAPTERTAWDWEGLGYARKTWLYLYAYQQVFGRQATMVHIFVEKETAYPQLSWFWTNIDSPAAQWGEIEALRVLGEIQRCEDAEDFRKSFEPGAPGEVTGPLPLPGPILNKLEFLNQGPLELDVGGRKVTL